MDPNKNKNQSSQEGMNKSLRELDDFYRQNASELLVANLPEDAHTVRTMYYANHLAVNQAISRGSEVNAPTAYPEIQSHLQELHLRTQNIIDSSEVRQNLSSGQIYKPPTIEMPKNYQLRLSPTPVYKPGYEEGYQAGIRDALSVNENSLCPSCSSRSLPVDSSWPAVNHFQSEARSNVDYMDIDENIVDLHHTVIAPSILEDCDVSLDDSDRSDVEIKREEVQDISFASVASQNSHLSPQLLPIDIYSSDTELQFLDQKEPCSATNQTFEGPVSHLSSLPAEPSYPINSSNGALADRSTSGLSVGKFCSGMGNVDNCLVPDIIVAESLGPQVGHSTVRGFAPEDTHVSTYENVDEINQNYASTPRLETSEVFDFETAQSTNTSESEEPNKISQAASDTNNLSANRYSELEGTSIPASPASDIEELSGSATSQSNSFSEYASPAPETTEVFTSEHVEHSPSSHVASPTSDISGFSAGRPSQSSSISESASPAPESTEILITELTQSVSSPKSPASDIGDPYTSALSQSNTSSEYASPACEILDIPATELVQSYASSSIASPASYTEDLSVLSPQFNSIVQFPSHTPETVELTAEPAESFTNSHSTTASDNEELFVSAPSRFNNTSVSVAPENVDAFATELVQRDIINESASLATEAVEVLVTEPTQSDSISEPASPENIGVIISEPAESSADHHASSSASDTEELSVSAPLQYNSISVSAASETAEVFATGLVQGDIINEYASPASEAAEVIVTEPAQSSLVSSNATSPASDTEELFTELVQLSATSHGASPAPEDLHSSASEPAQSSANSHTTSPACETIEIPTIEPTKSFFSSHGGPPAPEIIEGLTTETMQADGIIGSASPENVDIPTIEPVQPPASNHGASPALEIDEVLAAEPMESVSNSHIASPASGTKNFTTESVQVDISEIVSPAPETGEAFVTERLQSLASSHVTFLASNTEELLVTKSVQSSAYLASEISEVSVTEPMESFASSHGASPASDTKDSDTIEPVQSNTTDQTTSPVFETVEVLVTETVAETVHFSVSRQSTSPASDYQSLSSDSIYQDELPEPSLEDHVTELVEPEAELNVISSKGSPSDEILDREDIIESGHADDSLYRSLPSFQEDFIPTTTGSSPFTQADNNFCSVETALPLDDAERRTSESPIPVSDSVPEHPDLGTVQVDSLQESSPANDSLSVPEDLDVSPTLQTSNDCSDLNRCQPSSNARDSNKGPQDECSLILPIIQPNDVHTSADSNDKPALTQESSSAATQSDQPVVFTPALFELASNTESSSRMSEPSTSVSPNSKKRRLENGTVTQPGSPNPLGESPQKRQRMDSPGVSDNLKPVQSLVVNDAHPFAEDSEISVNSDIHESDSEVALPDSFSRDTSQSLLSPPATHVRSRKRRLPRHDSDQGEEFSDSENEADNSLFGFLAPDFSQPGSTTTAAKASTLPSIRIDGASNFTSSITYNEGDTILGSDGEYYDCVYETVSASEYATPDEGGVPIQIKPRRREKKLVLSYRLKIKSSRELKGLGAVPREVSTPYALRRTLPEGTPKKKRRTNTFTPDEGGPTHSTSLTRANATPYILREAPIEASRNPELNTSLITSRALLSPRPRRRLSRPPPSDQLP